MIVKLVIKSCNKNRVVFLTIVAAKVLDTFQWGAEGSGGTTGCGPDHADNFAVAIKKQPLPVVSANCFETKSIDDFRVIIEASKDSSASVDIKNLASSLGQFQAGSQFVNIGIADEPAAC